MKLLTMELVNNPVGSIMAYFSWEHGGIEFYLWRIIKNSITKGLWVAPPRIKFFPCQASPPGYRQTVKLPRIFRMPWTASFWANTKRRLRELSVRKRPKNPVGDTFPLTPCHTPTWAISLEFGLKILNHSRDSPITEQNKRQSHF